MKAHPYAELLPSMRRAEFDALKASIETSGLRVPVVLFEKQILDGVHRWRACAELGVTPQVREFDTTTEGDPLAFVIDLNVPRRHLDVSQRAMVAARLANLQRGANQHGEISSSSVSMQDAANKLSVDRKTVVAARVVLDKGTPELVKAVERGRVAVSAARTMVHLEARDQVAIAAESDDAARRRMVKSAKERIRSRAKPEPPPAELILVTSKSKAKGAKHTYSVEDWKALSKTDRVRVIDEGFAASGDGMNEQTGTAIEWARFSHNTVTGCLHDCPYCYARDIANSPRMAKVYPQKFQPTFHPHRLAGPGGVTVPDAAKADESYRNIFANSMSDLFGQWVPAEWIEATLEMARRNPHWNFLTLTKFPQRAAEFVFPTNVWMGTTVDAQARVANAEKAFAKIKCETKWLSLEPLLEPLTFRHLELFHWVVIGGASKSDRTPAWIPPFDWVVDVHRAARDAGCRIYHKTNLGASDDWRVREFPWVNPTPASLPQSFVYLRGMGK